MSALLEVRSVRKNFGAVEALRGMNLTVEPGEAVAVVGDNGAGKSTLIKVISGVHHADGGEILLNGAPVHFQNPRDARKAGIETIYQDLALANHLNVGANIFLGRELMKNWLGFLPVIDTARITRETVSLLNRIESKIPDAKSPVLNLSGGQRQAVAIARAMYWKAKLVIMDEPTAALAVPEARNVLGLINTLKNEGIGVIYIDHNLILALEAADRVVVMNRGNKVFETAAEKTTQEELVQYMTGRAAVDEGEAK
jgi:simple sugar transport system ATP-binding protein